MWFELFHTLKKLVFFLSQIFQVPYFICHIQYPFGKARAGLPATEIRSFTNGFVVAGAESCVAVWRREARNSNRRINHLINCFFRIVFCFFL